MFGILLLFAPLLRFLVKPIFSRYFRKFLVTTSFVETSKWYIDKLLSFQLFLLLNPEPYKVRKIHVL